MAKSEIQNIKVSEGGRGQAQFDAIIAAARNLPIDDVKRIWKAKCDACLIPSAAPDFYWQDRWLAKAGAA